MIVQRVKIIDELLVVFKCDVRLRLLDVVNLTLIACKLLLNLLDHSLVVFYFQFDIFICYTFGWVFCLGLSLTIATTLRFNLLR